MTLGAFTVRLPAEGWRPDGWDPEQTADRKLVTRGNVTASNAIRTPQFWLLWVVLFCNVTAGIGILEQASPMIQDHFDTVTAAAAAGFVGLLSLCNMGGRIGWSSLSDVIGRKRDLHDVPRRRRGPVLHAGVDGHRVGRLVRAADGR